jgi:hypothetical protein
MADNVDLVNVMCPTLYLNLDFHEGRWSVAASTRGCNSDLLSW